MSLVDDPGVLEEALHRRFGLERFRPGQREVIEQVLAGRDVLCVMPTGGGKSLCYQAPAVILPGVTLVVSPLIALMKDQVDALNQRGIQATLLNSTIDPAAQRQRMAEIEAGIYDLVYIAPERFRSSRFTATMARVRPSLMAIDEAHCISQWGHDFRPDYARLGEARRQLGSPPCIALTATATDNVRRDVAAQLNLRDPQVFVTGFDRPNLCYTVARTARDEAKLEELSRVLERNPGPSVVYASSRARCEMVAEYVGRELRRRAVVYHAGMEREARSSAQEAFMRGDADVVVATNAFGMGVDKADIRSVVHFNMPGTLEAYYQEAGRAGRDGRASVCALLFSAGDRRLQEMFIDNEYPPAPSVHQVYEFLRRRDDDPIQMTHAEIREESGVGLNESAVGAILKILDGAGAIEKFAPRENMAIVRFNLESDDDLAALSDRLGPQAHTRRAVLAGLEALTRGRVGEPCYFRPDELAAALGLERAALNRAVRSLAAESPIDYIPPFRGTAIRVVDRARKARDVTIDFARLEKRKRHEYEKLDRMTQYALSTICRRSLILSYFGERANISDRCDHCDNCNNGKADGGSSRAAALTIDATAGREIIQKVLSGVARAKGRFGKTTVAQMLAGSDSERMARGGLDQLSTFGVLRNSGFTHKEIADVIEALTAVGLIESQDLDRLRPVVALSEAGWAWLRDRDAPALVLDLQADVARKFHRNDPPAHTTVAATDEAAADDLAGDPLFERLRALRQQWARELSQPAYCIFSNQTIEALVRRRPTSPADLAEIKGLGRARIERYGAPILEAIAGRPIPTVPPNDPEHGEPVTTLAPAPTPIREPSRANAGADTARDRNGEASAEPSPTASPSPRRADADSPIAPASNHVSTEEWTWRLLGRGFSIEDASAIRGLDPAVVARHLTWMVRRGRALAVEKFLPPGTVEAWDAWAASHPNGEAPAEPAETVALWPLFRACRTGR